MYLRYLVIALIAASVGACSTNFRDVIDRDVNMSRKEFENNLIPKKTASPADTSPTEPPLPDMSQILVTPQPPAIGKDKLVSLSITEAVPLKDVLIELGRLADMDIEVDPKITGGIILKVKDKPLTEVVERVAQLGGLRYSYVNGILKIERDSPYIVSYPADFLNLTRSNDSTVSINTSLGSSGGGGGSSSGGSSGGGGSTVGSGSTTSIKSSYDGDLWKSIEADLNKIVGYVRQENSVDLAGSGTVPAAPAEKPTPVAGSTTGVQATGDTYISVNKQAGIINVLANSRQHKDVAKYLNNVKASISSQVLIEAKIVEVTLDDEYRSGVNWDMVEKKIGVGIKGDFVEHIAGNSDKFSFGVLNQTGRTSGASISDAGNINAIANLTQIFGVSRTLSSPRINAINNQQAVLSFAENKVFFKLELETTDAQVGPPFIPAKTTVTSELNTVPIGIILTLQPSINSDTNEITMNIRPTLSRITEFVADPGFTIAARQAGLTELTSQVPVVEVRELDSILKIKSGQVMVIGGLMEERSTNNDTGIPFVSEVPWAGNLFKTVAKTKNIVQTIIFIKATIVPSHNVTDEDKKFYKAFTRDSQPLAF